jgi:intermediate cleaving peptidase 55
MFVEPNNPEAMLWTGPRAGAAGFQDFFGLQNVYDRKGALAELVDSIARDQHRVIFLDHNENSFLGPELLSSLKRAKPLSELMHQLRLKKQPEELNLLRKSAQIAAEALTDSLRFSVTPIAKGEGCVAAHMEYRAKILGADRLAYVPVVARGDHALILHYVHNNQHFQDRSQLLLMDAGAQYFGYCSDITRTWPLSRRFTLPQRKLYEAVLNVQKGCLAALKVADKITLDELNDVSIYLTAAELDRLGFKNVQRHVNRLFPHSIGHHLGLDLHDCPTHKGTVPLEKGNVITVEPGIYVPYDSAYPAEYQGLGIRIEDDVIIGENGDIEVITSSVPSDPDAV